METIQKKKITKEKCVLIGVLEVYNIMLSGKINLNVYWTTSGSKRRKKQIGRREEKSCHNENTARFLRPGPKYPIEIT